MVASRAGLWCMHAERAFSVGSDRGNDKLRILSAQSFARSAIRVSAPPECSVSFPFPPPCRLLCVGGQFPPSPSALAPQSCCLMTTLSAIYEDFLFEIRHNLLEPFASCQLGSVFPSSCLLAKSGKQSRDAFTGSVLRFADGSLWVCPLHDSIFPPRVGEARLMEVRLVPMAGGEEARVDAAALNSSKPAVLLGVLCSDEAGSSAAPSMQRRGARAGTVTGAAKQAVRGALPGRRQAALTRSRSPSRMVPTIR